MRCITISILLWFLLQSCSVTPNFRQSAAIEDLPKTVQKMLYWEFHANSANNPAERGAQVFDMQHFEIPLGKYKGKVLVSENVATNLDPAVRDTLIFERDGQRWIRWMINPEDTKYAAEVKAFLEQNQLPSRTHSLFKGYLTASRSIILHNQENGAIFSVKVSTNKTGGRWQDKKVVTDHMSHSRMASDMIHAVSDRFELKHVVFQEEPAGFALGTLDQAMIVRTLGDITRGEHYLLPGFSALHEKIGREIAKLNGSDDPATFWKSAYVEAMGKAQAERSAHFAMNFNSAHSQQYLIELDRDFRPTGRIHFRDMADSYLVSDFYKTAVGPEFHKLWYQPYLKESNDVVFGIFHGTDIPSWAQDEAVRGEWVRTHFAAYEELYSRMTGIPREALEHFFLSDESNPYTAPPWSDYAHKDYFNQEFSPKYQKAWQDYLKLAPCFHGKLKLPDERLCDEVLKHLVRKSNNCHDAARPLLPR